MSTFGSDERSARELAYTSLHEVAKIGEIIGGALPFDASKPQRFMIYVLLRDDEPVYVGQTSNLEARIAQHAKNKGFNRYWCTEVQEREMSLLEARYIVALNPRMNMTMPSQVEFVTEATARSTIGGVKLRRAVKMGVMTGIGLHLGMVYPAGQLAEAVSLLGVK